MRGATALIVLAREPGGESNGRKQVLATAVRGLRAAGATVNVLALTRESGPATWLGCPVQRVAPPALLTAGASALGTFWTGRSFNEALFDCRRIRRHATAAARACGADVVVADTIRSWGAAAATGLPVIAHLDDLLSERYAALANSPNRSSVLGYYGAALPRWLRSLADTTARQLLAVEARRHRHREEVVACNAAVTALTASTEATILAARTGVDVRPLPMAVDPVEPVHPGTADPCSAVFLGGLGYGPNLEALRWWRDDVAPLLIARGTAIRLTVIGHAGVEHRREFATSDIDFLGYVDDLRTALSGHRMFVAPIRSGAGVKTKVLDGMSAALPVVATRAGLSGIPATSGVHALVADDAAGFADAMVRLTRDPQQAAAIGNAGRDLLVEHFASARLARSWGDALFEALAAQRGRQLSAAAGEEDLGKGP